MKKLLITFIALVGCISTICAKDILYLKNGSIIKGELAEVVPTGNVKFKTADGNIFAYATTEVIKITKEDNGTNYDARDILSLKNGSVIKGTLTEFTIGGNAFLQTNDGSIFVYASEDIEKITKNTSATTQPSATNYNKTSYSTPSESPHQQELQTRVNNRHLATRGYRGFVDFNVGYYVSGVAAFEISTAHGYQLNHNFFVGAGIGLDYLLGYESIAIPVYAAFKGNLGSGVAQFTYGSRIGFSVVSDYIPFLWNVNVGLRLGFTPKFALQITPDFSLLAGDDFLDVRLGLRFGLEF